MFQSETRKEKEAKSDFDDDLLNGEHATSLNSHSLTVTERRIVRMLNS